MAAIDTKATQKGCPGVVKELSFIASRRSLADRHFLLLAAEQTLLNEKTKEPTWFRPVFSLLGVPSQNFAQIVRVLAAREHTPDFSVAPQSIKDNCLVTRNIAAQALKTLGDIRPKLEGHQNDSFFDIFYNHCRQANWKTKIIKGALISSS